MNRGIIAEHMQSNHLKLILNGVETTGMNRPCNKQQVSFSMWEKLLQNKWRRTTGLELKSWGTFCGPSSCLQALSKYKCARRRCYGASAHKHEAVNENELTPVWSVSINMQIRRDWSWRDWRPNTHSWLCMNKQFLWSLTRLKILSSRVWLLHSISSLNKHTHKTMKNTLV